MARLGLVFEVVGLVGLGVVVSTTVNVWVLVPWLAAYGIGLGMASAQLPGVILSDVPTVQSGQASGIQSTNRQVGSAFGIAVLGTIFATEIGSRTASAVRAAPTIVRPDAIGVEIATRLVADGRIARPPRAVALALVRGDAVTVATEAEELAW
ncbi:MAG: hypothetical protein ACYCS4_13890 [Acidimicrobiales bacterium]